MDLLRKPWRYINEGNKHIVLQIVGTDYVLRLIKEGEIEEDLKGIQSSVDFVNKVMFPLLVSDFSILQEVNVLSADEIKDISVKLSNCRPEYRKTESRISCYTIRALDLSILSPKSETNYCIEIKPKEGFIAESFRKFSKCYFCLKQFLKLQNGQIDNISKYCPLDLFSGDKMRMKHALLSLVNNPQNNFKMFKDGHIIYSDQNSLCEFEHIVQNITVFGGSTNLFMDFIAQMLLNNNETTNSIIQDTKIQIISKETRKCLEENHLNKNTLLYNILHLQKLSENVSVHPLSNNEYNLDYIFSLLQLIKTENLDLTRKTDKEKFIELCDSRYLALISSIVKDCSLMISFSTNFIEGYHTIQIGESKIPYKVSVTDLEPKPMKTLEKRLKTEFKLIDIYQKHVQFPYKRIDCKYLLWQTNHFAQLFQLCSANILHVNICYKTT